MRANRREFLQTMAAATGAVVLVPAISSCGSSSATVRDGLASADPLAVPMTRPADWDPILYNRVRGNAGAIPDSYLPDINGPDGEAVHLGKHLPYIPEIDTSMVPEGYVAIMWGDPELGYVRHPNAPRNESNNHEGHWYNWIRIRKATIAEAEEMQSTYSDWPGIEPSDNGAYVVFGGGDIEADSGKNTVYLAALPADVRPGDIVRVHAHCLTHGEYVDFIQV